MSSSTILLVAPATDPDRLVGFVRVVPFTDDAGRPTGDLGPIGLPGLARSGDRPGAAALGIADLRRRGAGEVRHVEWPHWTVPAIPAD